MNGWLNVGILLGFLALLALLWRLRVPTARRLPWLVWAPDVVLVGWGVYALWTGRWGKRSSRLWSCRSGFSGHIRCGELATKATHPSGDIPERWPTTAH
jgi:hypothetical protein